MKHSNPEGFSLTLTEYSSCEVNGYTFYALEASYHSVDDMNYYDLVYVQISETECIEICGAWTGGLEDFVNTYFYITDVKAN